MLLPVRAISKQAAVVEALLLRTVFKKAAPEEKVQDPDDVILQASELTGH